VELGFSRRGERSLRAMLDYKSQCRFSSMREVFKRLGMHPSPIPVISANEQVYLAKIHDKVNTKKSIKITMPLTAFDLESESAFWKR
jgi:hypothetical protein